MALKLRKYRGHVCCNLDKHYLQEIEKQGYAMTFIPSHFLPPHGPQLSRLFAAVTTDQLIFKPCISGVSKNTLAITGANYADL